LRRVDRWNDPHAPTPNRVHMTTTRDYLAVAPPAGTRIAYGTHAEQFGDIRVPAGDGPHPVVVIIHGGWWKNATPLTYAGHLAAALTAAGFATWTIEYRRVGSPDAGYPATLVDATAALAHLHVLEADYRLDLARIAVTGHSAGAHLAAWLAAKQTHPELDVFGRSPRLIGAVPVAGPLDLERTTAMGVVVATGDDPVRDFLEGAPADVPDRYALASPVRLLPVGIPVVAVHGTADASVPLELSQVYVDRAVAAGDPARLIVLADVDHFEPFDPATAAGAAVQSAIRSLF
jgi:acetyl esterase/lipase